VIRACFALIEGGALLPHEQVEEERLTRLLEEIGQDGYLREPVLVDHRSLVILDGHHRVRALLGLGCRLVPAYLVDYGSEAIEVWPRREDIPVDKAAVVERGTSGRLWPPRTSRHVLRQALKPRPVGLALLVRL